MPPCPSTCDEAIDACVGCPSTARSDCRTAEKDALAVRNSPDDRRDRVEWRWIRGVSTTQAEFADPRATALYTLCLYQGSAASLAVQLPVAPDASRWQAVGARQDRGFKYVDPAAAIAGARRLLLRTSDTARSRVGFVGRGLALPEIPLPFTLPVKVQLLNSQTGLCWASELEAAARNDAARFRAVRR
jgi:hypothetical protein